MGVAVNAGAWYMGSAMDDTRFAVYAVPAEGVTLEALEEHIDRVLRRVPEALGAEAIERAKIRLMAETVYSSDSQSSLARIYGSALAIGETVEECAAGRSRSKRSPMTGSSRSPPAISCPPAR